MSRRAMPETDYPAVRRVMGSVREVLDDEQLEQFLAEQFPGADPLDVEDFMGTIQRFGRRAAPLAKKALPGAIQGGAQGAAIGGPWGGALGFAVGAASSLAASPTRGASSQVGAVSPPSSGAASPPPATSLPQPSLPAGVRSPSTGPPIPPTPTRRLVLPAGGNPNAAAAQMLALLSRPETLQALLALLLTTTGRERIKVGRRAAPPALFANAIAEVAGLMTEAHQPVGPESWDYLMHGASPRAHSARGVGAAAVLLGDLAEAEAEEVREEGSNYGALHENDLDLDEAEGWDHG